MHYSKAQLLELLIRSMDETLNSEERAILDEAVLNLPWLARREQALKQMRSQLASFQPHESLDVSDAVWHRLQPQKKTTPVLATLFPKVAVACSVLLVSFATYLALADAPLDTDGIIGVSEISPDEAYDYFVFSDSF